MARLAVGSMAFMVLAFPGGRTASAATLEPSAGVTIDNGADITAVSVRAVRAPWRSVAWDDLDQTQLGPGRYEVRFAVDGHSGGSSLALPHCAGRERVTLDGDDVPAPPGPLVIPLSPVRHEVVITIAVSGYERRIACGDRPKVGTAVRSLEGLDILRFPSPWLNRGGGRAVVYVPVHHNMRVPAPLLVGLHPWNGSIWTYAAYAQLLREARARDLVLLMPSGLGNSLYTSDAEDEVMRALAALSDVLAVDRYAISLWGASMGGAGATTIGFHHPDRFASVISFFGDCKYDLTTYVHSILPNEAAAHRVNALDVVDNARNLPVWLIHGEEDHTSPIAQSEMLATAMVEKGFRVRFDRVTGVGHSGALVAHFLSEVAAFAASVRAPEQVTHFTFRSVRASDTEVYGVRIVRTAATGDAFVEVKRSDDAVHVRRADGVRAIALTRGALGTSREHPPRIAIDAPGVEASWEVGAAETGQSYLRAKPEP